MNYMQFLVLRSRSTRERYILPFTIQVAFPTDVDFFIDLTGGIFRATLGGLVRIFGLCVVRISEGHLA